MSDNAQLPPWVISVRRTANIILVGIPDVLGGFGCQPTSSTSLEVAVGEHWMELLLAALLPPAAVWGWWTRSSVFRSAQLAARRGLGDVASVRTLEAVMAKRLLLRGMTFALVPPLAELEQRRVLYWAGQDTEAVADLLFTPGPRVRQWCLPDIMRDCHKETWRDAPAEWFPRAERLIVIFDGSVYCAVASELETALLGKVCALAAEWKLTIAEGKADWAWPNGSSR